MATQTMVNRSQEKTHQVPNRASWLRIGLGASLAAIAVVLVVQALAISAWPEIASFKPLDSYGRTVIFTLVPAVVATILFARFVRTKSDPANAFLKMSVLVLFLSFIPDYALPDPNRTLLASSVAAFMHLVAAIFIVGGILIGYRRETGRS